MFSISNIDQTAYGLQIQPKNDPYVAMVDAALTGVVEALVPGAFLVDLFPIRELMKIYICSYSRGSVRYIPAWFPGASFMRKTIKWEKQLEDMSRMPYELARAEFVSLKPITERSYTY